MDKGQYGVTLDPNFILNGLSLALLIWIAGSVSGLRERVTRIETKLQIFCKGKHNVKT